jgi:hypothetical protein
MHGFKDRLKQEVAKCREPYHDNGAIEEPLPESYLINLHNTKRCNNEEKRNAE